MERWYRTFRTQVLIGLVLLGSLSLSACSIPPPPTEQAFRATDHFQGKALELAQTMGAKDAVAIRHLIKDEITRCRCS